MKILFFFLISIPSYSQIFSIEYIAIQEYNDSTKLFDKFGGWEDSKGIVHFSSKTRTIEVFLEFKHTFSIIEFIKEDISEVKYSLLMEGFDNSKNQCLVELVYHYKQKVYQLYIRYLNTQIVLQMNKI